MIQYNTKVIISPKKISKICLKKFLIIIRTYHRGTRTTDSRHIRHGRVHNHRRIIVVNGHVRIGEAIGVDDATQTITYAITGIVQCSITGPPVWCHWWLCTDNWSRGTWIIEWWWWGDEEEEGEYREEDEGEELGRLVVVVVVHHCLLWWFVLVC